MTSNQMPPVTYPTVRIGGETLTIKFSLLAEYKISEFGMDLMDFLRCLQPDSTDKRRDSFIIRIFAACVAHHYIERNEDPPSAEKWMARIEKAVSTREERTEAIQQIALAVFQEVTRHLQEVVKTQPSPKPVQEATAIPDPVQ